MSTQVSIPAVLDSPARADDKRAISKMAEQLPHDVAQQLGELARPAQRGFGVIRYHAERKRAYWLQHDEADIVTCIAFNGISSIGEAAELWTAIHKLVSVGKQLTEEAVADICASRPIRRNALTKWRMRLPTS